MGREEKFNPRSSWYLKRHPPVFAPISFPTFSGENIGFWHRLVNFIKRILDNLVRKGQLSPKEN